jgi:hypothetical protein
VLIDGQLTNCHRGVQVGPSSTGPCETVSFIGNLQSVGGTIPQLEFTGSTTLDRLPSTRIVAFRSTGTKTNPELLVSNTDGVLKLRNLFNLDIRGVTVESSPTTGFSCNDINTLTVRNANISNVANEGIILSATKFALIQGFNIENCGGAGITFTTSPTKVGIKDGFIKNTVNYGVFGNTAVTEVLVEGVRVDTVTGVSRGFYAGGGDVAFIRNTTLSVTTPLLVVTGTRKREDHNSWNPAIQYGSISQTLVGSNFVGDVVYNLLPSPGGVMGYVCTTTGSPGVWKSFGAIAA